MQLTKSCTLPLEFETLDHHWKHTFKREQIFLAKIDVEVIEPTIS